MENAYDPFSIHHLAYLARNGPVAFAGYSHCGFDPHHHPKDFIKRSFKVWVVSLKLFSLAYPCLCVHAASCGLRVAQRWCVSRLNDGVFNRDATNGRGFYFGRGLVLGWPFALFKVVMAGIMGFLGGLWADKITVDEIRVRK